MSNIISVTKDNFKQHVLDSHKPVIVDFWAQWCAPCKAMNPILEELSTSLDDIQIAKVDVGDQENGYPLATEFGVRGVPTFIVFNDGQPINTHVGSMDKTQLISFIEESLDKIN